MLEIKRLEKDRLSSQATPTKLFTLYSLLSTLDQATLQADTRAATLLLIYSKKISKLRKSILLHSRRTFLLHSPKKTEVHKDPTGPEII